MNESIETKIELIELDIAAAYDEAEAKGATMPQVQGSANLADAVASIPTGTAPTLITKQITENGTYTADDDNADGYSEVEVDVPDESKAVLNSLIDRSITTITSDATSIGSYGFSGCESLTEANFPEATSIGSRAFSGCKSLTETNFPKATSIESNAFQNCIALTEANFPEATSINSGAFQNCIALTETNFPDATSIGSYGFSGCGSIKYFDMSEVAKVPTLGFNAFQNTTCIFLFRDQTQLDEYASATNWSTLTNRFQIKEVTP